MCFLSQISIDGCKWSTPFSVDNEGTSHVTLKGQENADNNMLIRVDVRNGTSDSRYLVIFRFVSFNSPYR